MGGWRAARWPHKRAERVSATPTDHTTQPTPPSPPLETHRAHMRGPQCEGLQPCVAEKRVADRGRLRKEGGVGGRETAHPPQRWGL